MGELRMIRLRMETPKLFDLARRRRLPARSFDSGYVVHCAMKEIFGEEAPAPFSVVEGAGRWLTVLAYTGRTEAALADHARTYADPASLACCDLQSLQGKEMPADWPSGKRVGFELRVCPVVRLSSDVTLEGGQVMRAGAEVDAFLVRCWRVGGPVEREAVYRDWLTNEVERRGGLRLVSARVAGLRREGLLRRTHGDERRSHLAERPDVTFAGVAEITDGVAFSTLLARGLGRHRAFGFGMLLLRPPGESC